jgi:hypothetical protein
MGTRDAGKLVIVPVTNFKFFKNLVESKKNNKIKSKIIGPSCSHSRDDLLSVS